MSWDPWRSARQAVPCPSGRPSSARCWRCSRCTPTGRVSADALIDGPVGRAAAARAPRRWSSSTSRSCARLLADGRDGRGDPHARARLRAADRPRGRRRLRASSGSSTRAARARAGARAVARRRRSTDVADEPFAAARDPAARGAAAARRSSRRSTPTSPPGGTRELVGRARGARRRASAERAPARPADARAVPLAGARPTRSRPTARRARALVERDRRRARARSCGGCTRRSCARTPRSTPAAARAAAASWRTTPRWSAARPSSRACGRVGAGARRRGRDWSSSAAPTGIGRTRLAAELAAEVHAQGGARALRAGRRARPRRAARRARPPDAARPRRRRRARRPRARSRRGCAARAVHDRPHGARRSHAGAEHARARAARRRRGRGDRARSTRRTAREVPADDAARRAAAACPARRTGSPPNGRAREATRRVDAPSRPRGGRAQRPARAEASSPAASSSCSRRASAPTARRRAAPWSARTRASRRSTARTPSSSSAASAWWPRWWRGSSARRCSASSGRRAAASPRRCAPGCWPTLAGGVLPGQRAAGRSARAAPRRAPAARRCDRAARRSRRERPPAAGGRPVRGALQRCAATRPSAPRSSARSSRWPRDRRGAPPSCSPCAPTSTAAARPTPSSAALLGANHVLVGPMRREELRRAIELPARRAGLRVEAELVDAPAGRRRRRAGRAAAAVDRAARAVAASATGAACAWRPTSAPAACAARSRGWPRRLTSASTPSSRPSRARDAPAAGRRGRGRRVVRRRVALAELDADRDADVRACSTCWPTPPRHGLRRHRGGRPRGAAARVAAAARLARGGRAGPARCTTTCRAAREWDARRARSRRALPRRAAGRRRWTGAPSTRGELNAVERAFVDDSRGEREREAAARGARTGGCARCSPASSALLVLAAAAGALVPRPARRRARDEARTADAERLGAQALVEDDLDRSLLLARQGVALDDSLQTRGNLLAALLRSPAAIARRARRRRAAQPTGPESRRPHAGRRATSTATCRASIRPPCARSGRRTTRTPSTSGRSRTARTGRACSSGASARSDLLDGRTGRRVAALDLPHDETQYINMAGTRPTGARW